MGNQFRCRPRHLVVRTQNKKMKMKYRFRSRHRHLINFARFRTIVGSLIESSFQNASAGYRWCLCFRNSCCFQKYLRTTISRCARNSYGFVQYDFFSDSTSDSAVESLSAPPHSFSLTFEDILRNIDQLRDHLTSRVVAEKERQRGRSHRTLRIY
ncbi:hypothetical protein TNIN_335521 [Trichonephila inaurata madagascariensis]|uniref:Uncharacterized protein n=1 Tax=Trichonephila inaurata madagascariensis TaxID=2747483 RepID=A0A8X6WQD5_9ARAC|nr:hypothetical protein TNIN_335521 [Trichonephila inaurata madagascariensis]